MTEPNFTKLRITHQNGVATVTIDNPPINIFDLQQVGKFRRFLASVCGDPQTRVKGHADQVGDRVRELLGKPGTIIRR